MSIINTLRKISNRVLSNVSYPIAYTLAGSKSLKKNKYFCISMTGNSYGDNIKSLSDYISEHDKDAEIVWAFSSGFIDKSGCKHKSVTLYSIEYYKEMLTSKYILSNARLNHRMFHKRKGQIYLQTWHGTALKRIGLDARTQRSWWNKLIMPPLLEHDVRHTDIMLSGSRFMTNIYRDKFGFQGDMWEIGTPRNDIFFEEHPEIIEKVHQYYDIPDDKSIILYAPTFRSDGSLQYYDIDAQRLKSKLEQCTGKEYVFLARLHPNIAYREAELKSMFPKDTIYASSYPDMQELLYATDILVTDYSSSMFDFMYTGRPVIMYTPDWNVYDRGFYFKKEELPFSIILDNNGIDSSVQHICSNNYKVQMEYFLHKIGSKEKGNAAEETINRLKCYGK